MKILKESFASGVRLYKSASVAILLASPVVHSEAQIYTIGNAAGYNAQFNSSTASFTSWTVGVNQLSAESLYYSLDGGSVTPLTALGFTSATHVVGNIYDWTIKYGVGGPVTIYDTVLLTSPNVMNQTFTVFNNDPSNAHTVSLFQYFNFDLGGSPASQYLTLTPANNNSTTATVLQTGGGATLNWSGFISGINPGATTEVQADNSGFPFGAFLGNPSPNSLDNVTLTASGIGTDFGYEFDVLLAAGGNAYGVSEVGSVVVPEPSFVALISSGIFVLALASWRRRDKIA